MIQRLVSSTNSTMPHGIDSLGTTQADSLPIPLLVLAGLGSLLLLTAGGLAANKRIRALRAARGEPPATRL